MCDFCHLFMFNCVNIYCNLVVCFVVRSYSGQEAQVLSGPV